MLLNVANLILKHAKKLQLQSCRQRLFSAAKSHPEILNAILLAADGAHAVQCGTDQAPPQRRFSVASLI
jgi:hypothetical protein